jgi:hypothetical protein
MNDGGSNFISTQAIHLIYYKTKPDWAVGDMHNNRREGSIVARHLVSSQQSEPITKGWNKGIAMSVHKPSNSQLQSSWTSRLYGIMYVPASFKMVRNYLTNGRAAHPRIPESSAFYFFWQKILHLECVPHSDFKQNFLLELLTFSISNLNETCFWYNWYI